MRKLNSSISPGEHRKWLKLPPRSPIDLWKKNKKKGLTEYRVQLVGVFQILVNSFTWHLKHQLVLERIISLLRKILTPKYMPHRQHSKARWLDHHYHIIHTPTKNQWSNSLKAADFSPRKSNKKSIFRKFLAIFSFFSLFKPSFRVDANSHLTDQLDELLGNFRLVGRFPVVASISRKCIDSKKVPTTGRDITGQMESYFTNLGFPQIRGISLTKPPFGVRSCEVAIIWPDIS